MLLIAISGAWVLGIFLGSVYNLPSGLSLTGLVPLVLLFFYRQHRKYLVLAAASLVALFLAAFYYPVSTGWENRVSNYHYLESSEIKGTINTLPETVDQLTRIELSVRDIKINENWQPVQGTVLVYVSRYPEYRYGDILLLKGKLENPPQFDDFDYQAYLKSQGIYSIMRFPSVEVMDRGTGSRPLEWINSSRLNLSQVISRVLPEPQSSLAQGIILGMRGNIPDSLKSNLSISGTAHLLAISGMNLSIIAGILVAVGLWIFGRRHYIYVWLALFVIWFYAIITGLEPSVIRSAIMASIFLLAEILGRQKNAFAALAFSAAIMVGVTPQTLWNISFQLSFLAMVGLIFIAPSIQILIRKSIHSIIGGEGLGVKIATTVTDSLAVSLGAIIAVWPIIAYYFGLVSLIGPLATLLAAPVLPVIIVLGGITAVLGLFSLPVSQIIGWTAWLFLSYMLWLVNACAALPMAAINVGTVNRAIPPLYYLAIGLAIIYKLNSRTLNKLLSGLFVKLRSAMSKLKDNVPAVRFKWVAIPLLVPAFLISYAAATLPDGDVHVSFLDVGEGDAILIQSGNKNILIDGGPSPQAVSYGLSQKMPFWNRNLDLIILTHPHTDHLNGLVEVLQRYSVKRVIASRLSSDSPVYREWLNLIDQNNIEYLQAQSGYQIVLGNGAKIEILNSNDTDINYPESSLENHGIVSRLILDEISFLFTADLGPEGESELINQRAELGCTILKIAHHGSAASTSPNFLAAARPRIAVISTGADNTFGHPSQQVLTRLKEASIYRTDISGTIEFTTDGRNIWVKTAK